MGTYGSVLSENHLQTQDKARFSAVATGRSDVETKLEDKWILPF